MSIEELQRKRKNIRNNSEITLENIKKITDESYRVADIAHNSRKILDSLDREFESQTGLKGVDIAFLFIATALQCGRIFIINNISKIEKAGQGNRNENFLHNLQDKILNKFDDGTLLGAEHYYAPLNQIITGRGVPYDATGYANENFKLFKGANHRFATLGHDPILGLIFGTANILTNTITCVNTPPIITTNHVNYNSNLKNPRIGGYCPTTLMLKKSIERLIVTLNRLMTDTKFIRQVKEEFIFGGFNKMIQGDELDIKEVTLWE